VQRVELLLMPTRADAPCSGWDHLMMPARAGCAMQRDETPDVAYMSRVPCSGVVATAEDSTRRVRRAATATTDEACTRRECAGSGRYC
jgi:hypothetical protein